MKQFKLTEEIKQELSKDEWVRLYGWAVKKGYFDVRNKGITIGQMIELVKENLTEKRFFTLMFNEWEHSDIELCDVFWEAVKIVIENGSGLI